MKRYLSIVIASLILASGLVVANMSSSPTADAQYGPQAEGRLHFSHKSRYNPGSTFTMNIYVTEKNSRTGCTQLRVDYPTNLLQYVSSTFTGGSQPYTYVSVGNSNIYIYVECSNNPPKGTFRVGTVTFKAIGQGTAKFSRQSGKSIQVADDRDPTLDLPRFNIYPAKCPSGQLGTPPNCHKPPPPPKPPKPPKPAPNPRPNPSPNPRPNPNPRQPSPRPPSPAAPRAPSPRPLPPAASTGGAKKKADKPKADIKSTDKSDTLTDVVLTRSIHTAEVSFSSKKKLKNLKLVFSQVDNPDSSQTVEVGGPEEGKYKARLTDLAPLTVYRLKITADKGVSYQDSFVTLGYPVMFTVLKNNEPLADSEISFKNGSLNYSQTTNEDGQILFYAIPGKIEVSSADGLTQEYTVESIAADQYGVYKTQTYEFELNKEPGEVMANTGFKFGTLIGFIITALVVIGFIIFIVVRHRRMAKPKDIQFALSDTYQPAPAGASPKPAQQPVAHPQVAAQTQQPPAPVAAPQAAPRPSRPPGPVLEGEEEIVDMYEQARRDNLFGSTKND